jgi:hypothetical protein
MNAAEDRLSALMDAATCALDPPLDAILAEGERLGRTRRRRRRIAVVSGAAAVVLLAGAGVAVGMRDKDLGAEYDAAGHTTGQPHQASPIPASRAPTPSLTATSPFSAQTPALKPGEMQINADAAVSILRKYLPASWKFGSYPPSTPGSLLRMNVDDGKGIAQVFVGIAEVASSSMDPLDCTQQGFGPNGSPPPTTAGGSGGASPSGDPAGFGVVPVKPVPECYVETVGADKAMLEVVTSPPSKVVFYRVIVNRADGIAVEITVQNGDPESDASLVTRTMPPQTADKWANIALSPAWQLYVPALPGK